LFRIFYQHIFIGSKVASNSGHTFVMFYALVLEKNAWLAMELYIFTPNQSNLKTLPVLS